MLRKSQGVNILIGPTTGIQPEPLKGTKIHYLASTKFNIEATIKQLRLGGHDPRTGTPPHKNRLNYNQIKHPHQLLSITPWDNYEAPHH